MKNDKIVVYGRTDIMEIINGECGMKDTKYRFLFTVTIFYHILELRMESWKYEQAKEKMKKPG